MTNSESSRLDKIEALVESNARAIEALTENINQSKLQAERDRARLYQAMADLTYAQAEMARTHAQFQQNIYQRHNDLDNRQDQLSHRQGEIVEILKLLAQQRNPEGDR